VGFLNVYYAKKSVLFEHVLYFHISAAKDSLGEVDLQTMSYQICEIVTDKPCVIILCSWIKEDLIFFCNETFEKVKV
jgi:hypothetical protein